jgi:hypothetical protein
MFKKRLAGLAPGLVLAALIGMPAVAQAAPKWFIDGKLAQTEHEPTLSSGIVELKNAQLKPITCREFLGGSVWNESEKGFEETEAFTTWKCTAALPCQVTNEAGVTKEGTSLSAEGPPTFSEEKKEARRTGNTSLPWQGELTEKEPATGVKAKYLLTKHVKIWVVVPLDKSVGGPGEGPGCELMGGSEIPFEDQEGPTEKVAGNELAPKTVAGARDGLHPSHEVFNGEKTEKSSAPETGRLWSQELLAGYFDGELLDSGAVDYELLTAEE